jgi:hypothetical protein
VDDRLDRRPLGSTAHHVVQERAHALRNRGTEEVTVPAALDHHEVVLDPGRRERGRELRRLVESDQRVPRAMDDDSGLDEILLADVRLGNILVETVTARRDDGRRQLFLI